MTFFIPSSWAFTTGWFYFESLHAVLEFPAQLKCLMVKVTWLVINSEMRLLSKCCHDCLLHYNLIWGLSKSEAPTPPTHWWPQLVCSVVSRSGLWFVILWDCTFVGWSVAVTSLCWPDWATREEYNPLQFLVVEEVVEGPEAPFFSKRIRVQIRVVAEDTWHLL